MNRFAQKLETISDISHVQENKKQSEPIKEKKSSSKKEDKPKTRPRSTRQSGSFNRAGDIPALPEVERKEVRSYSLLPSTIHGIEEQANLRGYSSSSKLVQAILAMFLEGVKNANE